MSDDTSLFTAQPSGNSASQEPEGNINLSQAQSEKEINNVLHRTSENQPKEPPPSWYIMQDMPGTGERPEFLKDKFGTMYEQAKAYPELEKKLGMRADDAPEKYDFSLGEGFDDLQLDPETDKRLISFSELAKKNHIPQNTFTELLQTYFTWQEQDLNDQDELLKQQSDQFREQELEKIDPDESVRNNKINELYNFYKSRFPAIQIEEIQKSIQTARDFFLFESIMQQLQKMHVPSSTRLTAAPNLTRDQLREMQKNPLYGKDEHYTKRVDEGYKQLFS